MFRQHARDTGRPVHVDTLSSDKRFNSSIPAHPLSFDPKLYSPKEFQVFHKAAIISSYDQVSPCAFHFIIFIPEYEHNDI